MGDLVEVAVSSTGSSNSASSSIVVWDYQTSNNLKTYKNSENVLPHTLSFVKNEYLMAASSAAPVLRVWPIHNPNPLGSSLRTTLPGFATAIEIDPHGNYCVCGITDKVYVWQLSSGKLMAIGEQHYQKITCIKFLDDGNDFLSAGEDGQVVLWSLVKLFSQPRGGQNTKPRHIFSDHSMAVTDLHVGRGWPNARHCHAASVSLDRTLNFFRLAHPALLFTVVFNSPLSSVTMNHCETKLFVGVANGEIQELNLRDPPRTREYHISEKDAALKYLGHTDRVNSLCVSMYDSTLISGGNDNNIILWNLATRQMISSITQQAPITNVLFRPAHKNLFSKTPELIIQLQSFQRNLDHESPCIVSKLATDELKDSDMPSSSLPGQEQQLREDIATLKKKNHAMFQFAVNKLLD